MTTSSETALKRGRKLRIPGLENFPFALFFREFCKHPAMIGSIIPSSNRLIDRMMDRIDWQNAKLIVEYGPGVGTFTRPILERLLPEATLIAIDTNRNFIRYLDHNINDPRLRLVHGSAADLGAILATRGFDAADYIISGLPFSTLPAGVGPAIIRETVAALRPNGAFVTYQYSSKIERLLSPHFVRMDREFELMNIPPVHLVWSWKNAEPSADKLQQAA